MSDKISISIVAYNCSKDVLSAIESIEKCTSSLIEKKIYVIDNSEECADESGLILGEMLREYEDVEYIFNGKNIGFGAAHNIAIKKAAEEFKSDYHAIVNPDILLTEDTFARLMSFMDKNPDCGMVIPRILTEQGELQKAYRRELTVSDMFIRMFIKGGFAKKRAAHTMQDMDYTKAFVVPFAQGSFLVGRTKLLSELGGFDERYFLYLEDADLCKKVNDISSVMYCPDTSVIHKWEKGSHKNAKLFRLHLSSMIKYFRKWGWK